MSTQPRPCPSCSVQHLDVYYLSLYNIVQTNTPANWVMLLDTLNPYYNYTLTINSWDNFFLNLIHHPKIVVLIPTNIHKKYLDGMTAMQISRFTIKGIQALLISWLCC